MSSKDGREDPLNDASDPLVKQENFFKPPLQDMNTVFEIGLADRRSRAGTLGSGGLEAGPALSSMSARLAKSRFRVTRTKWAKISCLTPRSVLL